MEEIEQQQNNYFDCAEQRQNYSAHVTQMEIIQNIDLTKREREREQVTINISATITPHHYIIHNDKTFVLCTTMNEGSMGNEEKHGTCIK